MNRPDYQQRVAAFTTAYNLDAPLQSRMLDLVSEMGELSKEILNQTSYGKIDFKRSREWESEMGDIFYALVALANSTEVNLDRALTSALEKYVERIENKGDPGSR